MSDEPTSRRVTRSSRRINEGEQGPTSQQAIKAALPAPAAQVLDLAKPRGKAGRGRGRGSGSHGTGRRGGHTQAGGHEDSVQKGTETHEPALAANQKKAGQDVRATLAKKRGPPSPNKVPAKPSKVQKKDLQRLKLNTNNSGMPGNDEKPTQKPRGAGKKSTPDPDAMVVDEPGEQDVQRQSTEKPRSGKGKYLAPNLDSDTEMDDLQVQVAKAGDSEKANANDSDVAPSSRSSDTGDESGDGDVSEPDKHLQAIAHSPAALRAKFAEEQPTIDNDDDSEGYAGDITLRASDYHPVGLTMASSDQPSRPSSRCSNLSSLHLSQLELSDDSEDEPVQNPKFTRRLKSTTTQQTMRVSEKRTKDSTSKREEKRKKEIANWSDDNERKEYKKSTRTSSRSQADKFKKESIKEIKKCSGDSDALDTQNHHAAVKKKASDASEQRPPLRTDIVYSSDGKVNLTAQNDYLRKLISTSIDRVLAFITLNNAYPEADGGLVLCASKITYKAAKKLGYIDVIGCMDADSKYWKHLAIPVKERISSFRTLSKQTFKTAIIDGLGLGNLNREDWESISKDFSYVDPQLPGKNYTSRNARKPYEEPLVARMLHGIYFSKPSSLGVKFRESLPEYDGKKAVTNAMVAFVSIGIHASLDHKYTSKAFDISSPMQEIYRDHIKALELFKETALGRYQKLMTKLYEEAACNSTAPSSAAPRPVKYIDFGGMDDE